jgi:shikimate dehydrogenase
VIGPATRVAGVVGWPVLHSLSPAIHNSAFREGGLDWAYVAFAVRPGAAPEALRAMRVLGLGGLSVTMPHKEDAATAVDALAPAAAALRSVNTVVVERDGRLVGHSTDGDGFIASLAANDVGVEGRSVGVIGAGGAARSVVDALARSGASSVVVVNRSPDRARDAARLAGVRGKVGTHADLAVVDVVVNATSLGMAGGDPAAAMPCDPALLGAGQVVVDLVYHPLETAWLAEARAAGATAIDGLWMLVHQAVLQQELWTGRRPDPAVMRAAALEELARRA